jgi:hypothetical protein
MPRVGFESKIPAYEWAKTVHALDRAATVIYTIMSYTNQEIWHRIELHTGYQVPAISASVFAVVFKPKSAKISHLAQFSVKPLSPLQESV